MESSEAPNLKKLFVYFTYDSKGNSISPHIVEYSRTVRAGYKYQLLPTMQATLLAKCLSICPAPRSIVCDDKCNVTVNFSDETIKITQDSISLLIDNYPTIQCNLFDMTDDTISNFFKISLMRHTIRFADYNDSMHIYNMLREHYIDDKPDDEESNNEPTN